jgi:hypothetical protein
LTPGHSVAVAQQDTYQLIMDKTRTVIESAREGGVITGSPGVT